MQQLILRDEEGGDTPQGGGGLGFGKPGSVSKGDHKFIDFGDEKLEVPSELADKFVSLRDGMKSQQQALSTEYEQLKTKVAKYEADKKKAIEEAEKKRLEEAGNYEQALKMENEKFTKALASVANRMATSTIASELAKIEGFNPQATDDVVNNVRSNIKYDPDTDTVSVVDQNGEALTGKDGRQVNVKDFLNKYLEDRPYYMVKNVSPGMPGDKNRQHKNSGGLGSMVDDMIKGMR